MDRNRSAPPVPPPTAPADRSSDENAIRALVAGRLRAWNAADGDAFAAAFDEDAEYTVWNGLVVRGRAAIAALHRELFEERYRGSRLDSEIVSLRFQDDGTATVRLRSQVVLPNASAEPPPPTLPLLVLARRDDGWRVALFQNTPDLVASGGAPSA